MYSFQYRLISCYVLLLISLAVYAQSGKESFAGRVVDTETYQRYRLQRSGFCLYRTAHY